MAIPSKTRIKIICLHVYMNAVHYATLEPHFIILLLGLTHTRVIRPKAMVVKAKNILGPIRRTAMVAGSWKQRAAIVNIRMATEYRFPSASPRSFNIDVTDALEMMPLSSKFKLQSKPAIVHSRRSTFDRSFFSILSFSGSSRLAVTLARFRDERAAESETD